MMQTICILFFLFSVLYHHLVSRFHFLDFFAVPALHEKAVSQDRSPLPPFIRRCRTGKWKWMRGH